MWFFIYIFIASPIRYYNRAIAREIERESPDFLLFLKWFLPLDKTTTSDKSVHTLTHTIYLFRFHVAFSNANHLKKAFLCTRLCICGPMAPLRQTTCYDRFQFFKLFFYIIFMTWFDRIRGATFDAIMVFKKISLSWYMNSFLFYSIFSFQT